MNFKIIIIYIKIVTNSTLTYKREKVLITQVGTKAYFRLYI